LVPQSGHVPSLAGLPFFIVTAFGSFISFFALHFMQYPSIYFFLLCHRGCRPIRPISKKASPRRSTVSFAFSSVVHGDEIMVDPVSSETVETTTGT
jgi:hypothetical protein